MSEVEYNDDEVVPPTWLNEEFIVRMLRERGKCNSNNDNYKDKHANCNDVKIWNLVIKPATLRGDHYASLMFRASYKYAYTAASNDAKYQVPDGDGEEESVIIKTMPPEDSEKGQNLADSPLHETEHCMYTQVIPAFEAIWRSYGENVKFAGRLLYAMEEPVPVLVLEDLSPLGYVTLRGRPFALHEIHAIYIKLAKWHAVSYKLAIEADQKWSELTAKFQQMQHGLFKMKNLMKSPVMHGGLRTLIETLTDVGGFEKYLPQLEEIEPNLVARCIAMQNAYVDGVQGPIYVLNHGDFHAKNIMFCEDANGEAKDILFVDFQLNFFGTSTYDVRYSTYTVVGKQLRETKRDELLQFYFNHFVESLSKLQFKGKMPTFGDFNADWLRWKDYELYGLCTMCPLGNVSEGTTNELDINRVFTSEEYRKTFWKNPSYIAYIKKVLPNLLEDGNKM